jgi:hypothetical protein
MPNPFQQRSRRRKLVYTGLILALLTVSLFFRRFVLEPEATALQLREQTKGEVELTSSAVQLLLLGSRGLADCVLWHQAIEKQKKQQWNELELLVASITKLQPHFVSPWLFQSWNLAFNVAVECDRTRDKYYYVTRGVELLAEGERRNQGSTEEVVTAGGRRVRFPGNPDMRFHVGFFYHLKIAQSDEKYTMRCLFDLSCIDPEKRDPEGSLDGNLKVWKVDSRGRRVVNQEWLEEFSKRYPRLVRRLREQMGRSRPQDVVAFLEDNRDIPSRFEAPGELNRLKKPRDQFPVLPLPATLPPNLPDPGAKEFANSFDVHQASKAWYVYAQEPLPPPSPDPGVVPEEFDPVQYRRPKMATEIFRGKPGIAQVNFAENLEDEGWFDAHNGWTITDWFDTGPGGRKRDVTVGTEPKYRPRPAWQDAYQMVLDFAKRNGMYLTPERRLQLEEEAKLFREKFHVRSGEMPPGNLRPEYRGGGVGESFDAHRRLHYYTATRTMTNCGNFLAVADVERLPLAVEARRLFFHGKQLAAQAARAQALQLYEKALPLWVDLLMDHPDFRHVEDIQMETYEKELRYLRLVQQQRAARLTPVILGVMRLGMVRPDSPLLAGLPVLELDPVQRSALLPMRLVQGPLELIEVYEMVEPERKKLREAADDLAQAQLLVVGLTQGSVCPPAPLPAFSKGWMLLARQPSTGLAESYDQDRVTYERRGWWPFLDQMAIRQVRQQYHMYVPPVAPPTLPALPARGRPSR